MTEGIPSLTTPISLSTYHQLSLTGTDKIVIITDYANYYVFDSV